MYPIKQSTAITVPFFVHDANGDAATGLTDGSFTKRISKNGAAFGAMTVTITELENGWYSIPLSTAHSDTTGLLTIVFTNAGAKQVNLQFRVHARLPDDLAFPTTSGRSIDVETTGEVGLNFGNVTGTLTQANVGWVDANSRVDVGSWLGTPVTTSATTAKPEVDMFSISNDAAAANNAELDYDGTGYAKANSTIGTVTTNTDMRGTDNAALASVCTEARLAELDAANLPTTTDNILTDTGTTLDNHLTDIKGTGFAKDTHSLTDILADVTGLAGAAMRGTDSALLASSAPTNFSSMTIAATGEVGADVLEWLGTAVTAATAGVPNVNASEISGDSVAADNLESEYDGTGYKGYMRRATAQAGGASSITLDASASATGSLYTGLTVNIVGGTGVGQARIITAYDGGTKVATVAPAWTTAPASGSVFTLTQGHANVATWRGTAPNTLVSNRVDASVGAIAANAITATSIASDAITAAKIAADAIGASELATDAVNEIVDQVWNELQADHVTVGSMGEIATEIAAILVDTNSLNDTKIPDTISLANINSEVLDVLNTDTLTLPGQEAPSNTPTHREAIGWLYKVMRNKKTQTATEWKLFADDTTTVDAKATVSDDGTTATKTEIATGP